MTTLLVFFFQSFTVPTTQPDAIWLLDNRPAIALLDNRPAIWLEDPR